jgi:hypothetical protein
MQTTTYNFRVCKGSAPYTTTCSECGKTLNRKAVVEQTVNPYNLNADQIPKTAMEVYADANEAARIEAAKLQDVPAICRDCDEKDNRNLLLEMAAEPNRIFPGPETYWNSAMHWLADRKQVEAAYEKCNCGAACCSGWKSQHGYRITKKGLERAAKLRVEPADVP